MVRMQFTVINISIIQMYAKKILEKNNLHDSSLLTTDDRLHFVFFEKSALYEN